MIRSNPRRIKHDGVEETNSSLKFKGVEKECLNHFYIVNLNLIQLIFCGLWLVMNFVRMI